MFEGLSCQNNTTDTDIVIAGAGPDPLLCRLDLLDVSIPELFFGEYIFADQFFVANYHPSEVS